MKKSAVIEGRQVLVVTLDEDAEDKTGAKPIAQLLALLAQEKAQVTRVSSGAGATAYLSRRRHVDVIFFDLSLLEAASVETGPASYGPANGGQTAATNGSGPLSEFIETLRADPALRGLPVVAVGGKGVQAWSRAIAAGAVEQIPYSVNREELMRTLETASMRQAAIVAEVQRQVEQRYHDIIGIIQHEFRTPMTLLMGYSEYLRETLDQEISKEELKLSIDAILDGSIRLNRLIESFLLLSELQYRRPRDLELQSVEPELLWREVQAILHTEVEEAGLEIVYEATEEATEEATGAVPPALIDVELVREALTRLLDNALRYVRPDSRQIRLSVALETAFDIQWVNWIIVDEGPGIEADQLHRIAEPFGRIGSNRYLPQSAGLSLAIVKRVAELHGGMLSVESQVDEGSRFVLRLPLAPPAASLNA
jgi:two-component system, sensor histidine kinase and response regulator